MQLPLEVVAIPPSITVLTIKSQQLAKQCLTPALANRALSEFCRPCCEKATADLLSIVDLRIVENLRLPHGTSSVY